ncbi:SIR2 family protein [Nitrososphaera sp.]|uniref:SIR2 family protein n=1 Tax=Nitrososphaera sp. TaxID=1971748 RepID=UPI0017E72509|nr:SIR2 family protein [Nitrososphaera sp.]NWG36013.1 SIR2 family protein [Nitrososphaera sp.]
MRIALFLGAGASVAYGKPTTRDIKNKLQSKYRTNNPPTDARSILFSFLDNYHFNDIEDVLQSIYEWDRLRDSHAIKYLSDEKRTAYIQTPSHQVPFPTFLKQVKEVKEIIEDDIFENYSWDRTKNGILLEIMARLIAVVGKSGEAHIFTTNYDRAVEQFCILNSAAFKLIDGFGPDSGLGMYTWTNNTYLQQDRENDRKSVYLYKLHGSLDWKRNSDGIIVKTGIERRTNDPNISENIAIMPTISPKDGAEKEPFKTILQHFSRFMNEADVCIVIGYSFRDAHINEVFSSFLSHSGRLIVVSPNAKADVFGNLYGLQLHEDRIIPNIVPVEQYLTETTIHEIISEISKHLQK